MARFELTDGEVAAANRRGEEERARCPVASTVRYDASSGRIVVDFVNGASFMVPARALQNLGTASDEDLAEVEILGHEGFHREALDVDFRIPGPMAGIFGTARFMEAARRGGQSRSPAKIAAARENGCKGGRPRKAG